jgi:phenylacetate-coenzyme A ligase PaaK-like adenylate-forming protein
MFTNEQIDQNIQPYLNFYHSTRGVIFYMLVGTFSKKIRGITLGFNGKILEAEIFFDSNPTENEIEVMDDLETEIICSFPSDKDYCINFIISVVASDIDISDRRRNWGWIFLRKES